MLSLTDDQLSTVFAAAQPLDVNARDLFLRDVARALARTCREIQRRYWHPPADAMHPPAPLRKIGHR